MSSSLASLKFHQVYLPDAACRIWLELILVQFVTDFLYSKFYKDHSIIHDKWNQLNFRIRGQWLVWQDHGTTLGEDAGGAENAGVEKQEW